MKLGGRHRQRGVAMVFITIAMAAMLAFVGLALDGGHSMVNRTRIQSVVDAAALSAAKTLDQTIGDVTLARAEALAMFSDNADALGHSEIRAAYDSGELSVTVEFSSSLDPFAPGTTPAQFVRVRAQNFRMPGWFIPVLGIADKVVGASAVAGPSPTLGQVCNVAPMMACGEPGAEFLGYEQGAFDVLKMTSPDASEVGPGNFHLARLDGASGGADIRTAMAGDYDACVNTSDDTVATEPGNTMGPVLQGINTRLGIYDGPMKSYQAEYPPDVITTEPEPRLTYVSSTDTILYDGAPIDPETIVFDDYQTYQMRIEDEDYDNQPLEGTPSGPGQFGRRILALPVVDCSGETNGAGEVPLLGVLCFYLLQRAELYLDEFGNETGGEVYGQFVGECNVTGRPGPLPDTGPGPYVIQLYKDPDAQAS